jgi:GDP/UDP-N,N'-diacetylbacillosamine 2-epimerase (hydrolysing)
MADVLLEVRPDIVLVQGDRGEMLAAASAAAHLNVAVVHMSGGDRTGTIDDAIRNAITSFAHVHLSTCDESSARLRAMGESGARVFQVGEPALDVILALQPIPRDVLCAELGLDHDRPIVLATQHSVTDRADRAGEDVKEILGALTDLGLQTVFTYPNTDSGHEAIVDALQSWQPRSFLHVVPHLGQLRYLSLMREAAMLVGNSSSGILEAPSFAVPVVNVGTRQHRRTRACNVIDAVCDRRAIRVAMERALHDESFRAGLANCVNPYGDGRCAERTAVILGSLRLGEALTAKWLDDGRSMLVEP